MIINDCSKLALNDITNKLITYLLDNEKKYNEGHIPYSIGTILANDQGSSYIIAIDYTQLLKHVEKYKEKNKLEHLLSQVLDCEFSFSYFKETICDDAPTTYLIVDHKGKDVVYLIERLLKANPIYNASIIVKDSITEATSFFPNLKYPSDEEDEEYVYPVLITKNYSKDNKQLFIKVNTHKDLLLIFDDNRIEEITFVVPKEFKDFMDAKTGNKESEEIEIEGFTSLPNTPVFLSKIGNKCKCLKYSHITYEDLIDLEKASDIFNINETFVNYNSENSLMFYAKEEKHCLSFDINTFTEVVESLPEIRQKEMVNDVISLVPVRYNSRKKIIDNCCIKNNFLVDNIITGIVFQEYFECGSTSQTERTFADRISRYDLGDIIIQPLEEIHYNYFAKINTPAIGDSINARLIVAIDNDTQASVLYICALAINNLPTKYLDDISRNEVFIDVSMEKATAICKTNPKICCKRENGKFYINLSDYLAYQFEIEFVGAPRNLIISPRSFDKLEEKLKKAVSSSDVTTAEDDNTLDYHILSSLLYGESYFDESEELGQIIDPDIFYSLKNKWGWSLYNYAKTYMAKTSVIQAAETYRDYVLERVDFEVVTLYYIELVLFESSAIQIATADISEYIKNYRTKQKWYIKLRDSLVSSSGQVLKKIEHIQGEYAKTIDFWDVQMSYYSSKKMLDFIRLNFDINNDLEQLERTRNETEGIYQSKKTNISNRNGLILAIMGFILTISSIYEIFMDYKAASAEATDLHEFEKYFFENVSEVLLIKIIAIAAIAVILIRYATVKVFGKKK